MSDGFAHSKSALRELAQAALDHASARGASACEVDVSEGFGQSVSVRRQEVETIEYNRDKGLGVTVYLGQRRGHASSSDFSLAALAATVDAALSIARFTAEDDCAGLPEAKLLAKRDMDRDRARAPLRGRGLRVSPKISNSEGANTSIQQSHFVSANSHGFLGGYATTRHGLSCSVIAGEGDAMQREYWYDSRRAPPS
jgi:PmbA protein